MSWVGVITDAGRALYEQVAAGGTLNISSLKLGSGSVSESSMRSMTALDDEVTDGVIESINVMTQGVQFRLRANAAPASIGAYTLTEMGVFASMSGVETLFAYCMDTGSGIGIPSEETFPDFIFILTADLILDNHAELSFTVDPSSFISYTQFVQEQTRVNTALENKKGLQTAVPDPTADGEDIEFISGIIQSTTGVITPTKKTVRTMTGATNVAAGKSGLVPPPAAGKQLSFLRGDGTWVVPTNTTYTAGEGLTLTGTTFSVTKDNVNTMINLLDTGNSDLGPNDYVVTQYAGGGTTTTTYHRRPASAVVNAALVKDALGTNDAHGGKFLRMDGTWAVPTNTTYSSGTGLSLSGTTFSLATSGVTAGSYGPSANVTGNNNATMSVPYLTVDTYGRVTAISNKTITFKNTTYSNMTGASASAAGAAGLVPAPAKGAQGYFLRGDGTWAVPANTTYSAGTGLSLSGTTFSLATSGVTAGSYGPTGNVTGNNGTTLSVPQITVDKYGRVTGITTRTYTSVNTDTNTTYSAGNGLTLSGTTFAMSGSFNGNFTATKVYNAVWNDYAECRETEEVEPGRCVRESKDKNMKITTERLMAGCKIVSDTFGSCMGLTDKAKTPVAVAGRVLAYPFSDPSGWELGAAVCSAPDGTVDIMTREEIREYPERIVGTVSEIPDYEFWKAGDEENPVDIEVNGRVWIYVR